MAIEGFERAQLLVYTGGVFHFGDADIEHRGSFGGNDVDSSPAFDEAGVEGEATLQIDHLRYKINQAGEFEDGALAFFEIESGVRGFAGDFDVIFADAFARGLDRAVESVRRLEHENGSRFLGEAFGDTARGVAANFFIGNEKDGDGTREYVFVPASQPFDGLHGEGSARFHVEHAGAEEASVLDVARHRREGAERIDRIEMAEQQYRLAGASGKVYLQMIAKICNLMEFGVAAESFEASGEESAELVHRSLVAAGRFDFDELGDGLDEGVFFLFEPVKALGGARIEFGLCSRCLFSHAMNAILDTGWGTV